MASRSRGKICLTSNDVNRPVVEGNYLVLVRTSNETREVYNSTLQVSNTLFGSVGQLSAVDVRDKFEWQIFLVLFFHCIFLALYL